MNIGMMKMDCNECGSKNKEYDARLGEQICKDCGLVLVTEMFEETVHMLNKTGETKHSADRGHLGSIITGKGSYKFNKFGKNSVMSKGVQIGLVHSQMVLSSIAPSSGLRERIEKVYLELFKNQVFGHSTYEVRATAIVYYVLRENGTPHPFTDVGKEFSPNLRSVKRLVRKMNQHFGNRANYMPANPQYLLEQILNKVSGDLELKRQCFKVLEHFEVIVSNNTFNKGRSYYASIIWITVNLNVRTDITQTNISEKTGFSRWIIRRQTNSLLQLVGIDSVESLKGKEINKIGE